MKFQEERKASMNRLASQEHIPAMWEHGLENRFENRSSAVQSKPDRKRKRKQTRLQKWKSKISSKLQRTFVLCKNTFPRCGNTDQKTGPKTSAVRCKANQNERKRQLAKLASKEAGRTHLREGSREAKQKL